MPRENSGTHLLKELLLNSGDKDPWDLYHKSAKAEGEKAGAGEVLAGPGRRSLVLIKRPSFTPIRNNAGEGGRGHMTRRLAWEP